MAGRKNAYELLIKPNLDKIRQMKAMNYYEKEIMEYLGVEKTTFYKYKSEHKEFADALKAGKIETEELVYSALLTKAKDGDIQAIKEYYERFGDIKPKDKEYFKIKREEIALRTKEINNIEINKIDRIQNQSLFRCKIYDPINQQIVYSYNKENEYKEILIKGGSASGKSIYLGNEIIDNLGAKENIRALIIVYSAMHKRKTKELIISIAKKQGFTCNAKNLEDGITEIQFGINNIIHIQPVKTSSIDELEEKFKTGDGIDDNAKYQYIWFEEFTAVLNAFRDINTFESAKSRLLRLLKDTGLVFYTFNPPNNRNHVVYEFINEFQGLVMHTTILDLPEKWRDKNTLEEMERLKEKNIDRYQHIYMGIPTLTDGLAFDIGEEIWLDKDQIRKDDYIEFSIQTDEATTNATTFGLFGVTFDGQIHRIHTFYHSSKDDGKKRALSTYAQEFHNWYVENGVQTEDIATDGLAFAEELKKLGYKAKAITSGVDDAKKDRVLSYQLLNDLILERKYRIVNDDSNIIVYEQLKNAELEYTQSDKPMVSKKKESTNDNKKHFHAGDCDLYMCLRKQKILIRGRK